MKDIRQIIEGKWYGIPKRGLRVTCCNCGAKHTAEFIWVGKVLKYRAFKDVEKRKCPGCKKMKVMQNLTNRCRQCFEVKNF
jgi:hypothetical protein